MSGSNVRVLPSLAACELCAELPAERPVEGIWICHRCATELDLPSAPPMNPPALSALVASERRVGPALEQIVEMLLEGAR
jgi:ribosomal protein L37AE/L43A